ncbi:hypothetical protein [Streptomyces hygroscopicus]|uniref:hypothetical protein n=1 Tax=Streptomyces hygroscopicus TaxID=1912 RepID=UPI000832E7D8|nr:hypothetical protein [Streptomyces hygroscopicus]
MPHRTALRHTRKAAAAMLIAVAALGLTACQDGETDSSSASSASSASASASTPQSAASTPKAGQGSASSTPSGTPKKDGMKCTDQINYAGDPRPNAEINSIGENTGYCPPVS